jgi:hypothetical protein
MILRCNAPTDTQQCDFLKSTILAVTAAHLDHLLPCPRQSRETDLQHISNALSGLRNALTLDMTIANFESIISCTTLLIHYAWICIGQDQNADVDIPASFGQISDHSRGLKDCVVVARNIFEKTQWATVLRHSPKIILERYAGESQSIANKFRDAFGHCLFCGLGTRMPANASNDNVDALTRLIIPMTVICLTSPDIESSGLMPDIYRYLFTWPTKCTKGYIQQVDEGNPVSLIILLFYYAAILRVDTERIWWMRDGASRMFNKLRSMFSGQCSRCIEIPLALLAVPKQPASSTQAF